MEKFAVIDGIKTRYVEEGSGGAVLLLVQTVLRSVRRWMSTKRTSRYWPRQDCEPLPMTNPLSA